MGKNIHRFYCFLYQTFSETTAKPRIIYFKIHNLTYSDDYYISKGLQFMFLVTGGTAVIFIYNQNGKYLAKSWSSAPRALESAHKFYSIRFYIDVSTFE